MNARTVLALMVRTFGMRSDERRCWDLDAHSPNSRHYHVMLDQTCKKTKYREKEPWKSSTTVEWLAVGRNLVARSWPPSCRLPARAATPSRRSRASKSLTVAWRAACGCCASLQPLQAQPSQAAGRDHRRWAVGVDALAGPAVFSVIFILFCHGVVWLAFWGR